MREHVRQLHDLIEPAVTVLGYELLGLELMPGKGGGSLLRVYIDSPQGITLDDCERVSHQVSGVLDVEDPIAGPYTLEVSSPGSDRPLFTPEHFEQHIGRRVRIRMQALVEGRRRFKGELKGYRDGRVVVIEDGEERTVPYEMIRTARLVPEE
ncbi:MAG: ribosome maturation factor RimP [Gammaproteobacteria bacterium]|nr:ribosome maturation factor RimP [Gammaproteobacteria bacterium]NIR85450.1 ribosome maturation factor RimP [Gammaproteobacteria bacterium]NIR89502.1 ribosome maturation factor RimP [Gammaproteobacteria bacterium]NIU06587.1 ribosome maturation factor RimP [Gammaproteobacteria bacterium]NIV53470.1 ribosome maturation factor RimP [Gammaproteobacteria bacterium]